MKILTTSIARILFGLPFLIFGVMHILAAEQMKMALPAFVPAGVFLIYLSGIGLIAGAISLYIQKYTQYAMIGISFFLLSTIALVHIPNLGNADPVMMQMAMSGMLKDLGLLGGALTYLGMYKKVTQ